MPVGGDGRAVCGARRCWTRITCCVLAIIALSACSALSPAPRESGPAPGASSSSGLGSSPGPASAPGTSSSPESGPAGETSSSSPSGAGSSASPGPAGALVPSADYRAIRHTIDAINATAGGPVARQRALLTEMVFAGQRTSQQECPEALSTLLFRPAYSSLRPAPEDAVDGASYLLPTLIKIFHGNRITGTDVSTLRIWMVDGAAHTAALCIR